MIELLRLSSMISHVLYLILNSLLCSGLSMNKEPFFFDHIWLLLPLRNPPSMSFFVPHLPSENHNNDMANTFVLVVAITYKIMVFATSPFATANTRCKKYWDTTFPISQWTNSNSSRTVRSSLDTPPHHMFFDHQSPHTYQSHHSLALAPSNVIAHDPCFMPCRQKIHITSF